MVKLGKTVLSSGASSGKLLEVLFIENSYSFLGIYSKTLLHF